MRPEILKFCCTSTFSRKLLGIPVPRLSPILLDTNLGVEPRCKYFCEYLGQIHRLRPDALDRAGPTSDQSGLSPQLETLGASPHPLICPGHSTTSAQ